jgi:thiol-disulfide isomerase/thioredoxin
VFPVVVLGIVVVFGVVLAATVMSGGDDDGGSGTGRRNSIEVSGRVSVDGTTLPDLPESGRDPAVGMAAPTVDSIDFAGDPVQVGGATGTPYALVFLAHWCPHCQAEVPRLVALDEGGRIEGAEVVAVATGTSSDNPNYPPSEWLAREDWPFGVVVDDGSFTTAAAYGLTGYPFMVFVDAEGTVVGRTSGEVGEDDLAAIFAALAAGDPLPLPGAGASSGT